MRKLRLFSSFFFAAVLVLGIFPGPAAPGPSGPSEVQLIVTPSNIKFRAGPPPSFSVCEVTIQVLAPVHTPWRLTVLALGPLQFGRSAIPASRVTWKGTPAPIFLDGTLSSTHPQLLARGEGPKVGVVRFLLKNSWDLAVGQFNQKFIFNLSTP